MAFNTVDAGGETKSSKASNRSVPVQRPLRLRHRQHLPSHVEPALQDARSIQTQLYRSLSAAATLAGFDGITSPALESFKSLAEEFIVSFLETVCTSMLACRRTTPIPQDFVLALAELDLSPSDLTKHVALRIPSDLSCPTLAPPDPDDEAMVDLSSMLGPDLKPALAQTLAQVPLHFPPLPSKHTWRRTAVKTGREKDPRKLRERAMQEGLLAEQSLRRLQAAAHAPRRRSEQQMSAKEKEKRQIWLEAWAELADVSSQKDDRMDREGDDSIAAQMPPEETVMVVNSDRVNWRKGAAMGTAHI